MRQVSLAVFKEVRGRLTFVDGGFGGVEPAARWKITANSSRSVRSHCERLLVAEDWGPPPPDAHPATQHLSTAAACPEDGGGALQPEVVANPMAELFGLTSPQQRAASDTSSAHVTGKQLEKQPFSNVEAFSIESVTSPSVAEKT